MMPRFVAPAFHTHSTSISVPVRPAKVTDRGSPARNSGRLLTQLRKSVGEMKASASVGPATVVCARSLITKSVATRYRNSTYSADNVSGTQPSDKVSVSGTPKVLASKTTGAWEAPGAGEATVARVGCGPPTAAPLGSRLKPATARARTAAAAAP